MLASLGMGMVQTNVRLPADLADRLDAAAKQRKVPKCRLVEEAVAVMLDAMSDAEWNPSYERRPVRKRETR